MFVSALYIRFFRSFNYDYLRKAHDNFKPDLWDILEADDLQYPFVRIPIEQGVTTVVGANESGKSQLLTALKCALTGEDIQRSDFCRYSQFFAVNSSMTFPDFGLELGGLDAAARDVVTKACRVRDADEFDRFYLFRIGAKDPIVYVPSRGGELRKYTVRDHGALEAVLPTWFEIDSKTALPASVPIKYLADATTSVRTGPRPARQALINTVLDHAGTWFGSTESFTAAAPGLKTAVQAASQTTAEHQKQLALADELLLKVAKIDRVAFRELHKAVEDGKDGFAHGLVDKMNRDMAAALNFPRWWSQDREFRLLLTLREQDLVFTVRDRTGTEYSADERSGGLRYFLSYFVQYLAHEPPANGGPEILLMDEPDAYLSSTGQQDLLRIFEDFATPQEPTRAPCQVVYVTHSPFLIDKNHGDRIRVLEKGEGDEGTRVVRNASRNHYEPLRSAFGSFVAETTFISNCNLMLEGMSDQVLLAGMSARLRRDKTPDISNLDLNSVTLVPAGSAEQIPYLVYLARGRDVERPAVIVLLDSDEAGNKARKGLERGPDRKPLIDPKFVLQLGELRDNSMVSTRPGGILAIEDLIPLGIAVAAVKRYADEFLDPQEATTISSLTPAAVDFDSTKGTHDALEKAAAKKLTGFHLDKVGFARAVIETLRHDTDGAEAETIDANFRDLFAELGRRQRQAVREITTEKTSAKVKRLKRSFMLDHPNTATREQGLLLLEEIDANLDGSVDAEALRSTMRGIRRAHKLDDDPTEPIKDYVAFRDALEVLAYREINEVQDPPVI